MADRARGEVAGDDARQALWRKLEYFPTPPWAARAGGELIAALDPGSWSCWEPACGEGHMAHGLAPYFAGVHATDIHPHGGPLQQGPPLDFLSPEADRVGPADWIVFNSPFTLVKDFVETGLRRARRGVAALGRSALLETHGRHDFFFGDRPCDLEAPFFDRVSMSLGRWESRSTVSGGGGATAHSWFIWFHDSARPAWLDDAQAMLRAATGQHHIVTRAIPPGTKARLTRPEDARDWAVQGAAPLFEGEA